MTSRRMTIAWTLAVGAALSLSVLSTSSAAPRQDLKQVQAQVRDLQMQAAAAAERAGEAQSRLTGISSQLDSIRSRAERERAELRVASATIEDMARAAYTSGGLDPTLEVLMAEDPVEFLNQAAVMGQLEQTKITQLRRAQTTRLRVAQTQAEIVDQESAAQAVRDEMAAAQAESDARLADAQAVLDGLEEAERQRLAALAEEERRQDLAAAAAAQADNGGGGGAGSGYTGSGDAESGGGFAGGSRAQAAVQYALSQVGDPYSFSANPPSSWDCSKLTAAAWGQSGVGLTALSYTQWDQTRRVPVSDIQPGDLVFYFGMGAHHVAIYIGGGKMVSASNPSDGVEIIDFLGPWYAERFSGVGRVI